MDFDYEGYKNIIDELKADVFAISYLGAIDRNLLALLAKRMEETQDAPPTAKKKLFKVFIELAQNVALYSAEKSYSSENVPSGVGIIILKEFNDYFQIYTGNLADRNNALTLKEKIDKINSLTHEQLREYKRLMRKKQDTDLGRGNIGLIQTALVSGNPIEYKLIEIDEQHYFTIVSSKIDKK